MSAAPEAVRAASAPAAASRPVSPPRRARPPSLARRVAGRLGNAWLPRLAWALGRTGRAGLLGVALLLAAGVFLVSTHLPAQAEVEALRAELEAARTQARTPGAAEAASPASTARALPARAETPGILRQLFSTATQAHLAIDTGRYEVRETRSGGVVRTHVTFPVTGPYPQIRGFLDTVLRTMPAVALSELALERKEISDGEVEAQLRMTIYTSAAAGAASSAAGAAQRSDRVVAPAHAPALFAQHTWTVIVPVRLPPPPPPPPPPEPTAPPLPYTFVGSYSPAGAPPVYFLSKGEAVLDVRVGDKLDGVYQLESAEGGQLVFVYLPLNIRQNISAGASK